MDYQYDIRVNIDADEYISIHVINLFEPYNCSFYNQIIKGNKQVEGVIHSKQFQKILPKDILLICHHNKGILECNVKYVNKYSDIAEYMVAEGIDRIFGDTTKCRNINDLSDGVTVYTEYIDPIEVLKLKKKYGHGFIGIDFEFVHEYKKHIIRISDLLYKSIHDGSKNIDVKLNKPLFSRIKEYDIIEYVNIEQEKRKIEVIVLDIKKYRDTRELLKNIPISCILPLATVYSNITNNFGHIFSPEKEKKYGIICLTLNVISY